MIHTDVNPIAKWMKGNPHGPIIRKLHGTARVTKMNKEDTNRQRYESTGTKLNEAGAEVQLKWNYFDWGNVGWILYRKHSIYGGISSYSRANEHISEYLSATRKLVKCIYSFIKCRDEGGFHDKSVRKTDIQFLLSSIKRTHSPEMRLYQLSWQCAILLRGRCMIISLTLLIKPM